MFKQYTSLGAFLADGAPLPSPEPVELARHEDDGGRVVPAPEPPRRPWEHLIGRSRKRARLAWEAKNPGRSPAMIQDGFPTVGAQDWD